MSTSPTPADLRQLPPLAFFPITLIADLGMMASLAASAALSLTRRSRARTGVVSASARHASWLIGAGLPLVALLHVSLGSFLAMQSYYGATFTEAAGAVVGLGMFRNLSPLIAGFVLSGLIGTKFSFELKGGPHPGQDDPLSTPDRDVALGLRPDLRPTPSAGRVTLVRILGAIAAGPVLATFGAVVGTLMGLLVSRSMLGLNPAIYLGKFLEMLQPIDIVGLAVKPAAFGATAALLACHEGLRPAGKGITSPHRAVVRSIVAVLFLNFAWFNLVYLAGKPFGPDVIASQGN